MKKILCFAALMGFIDLAFAQNSNPWPAMGNVGIGTSHPSSLLHIARTDVLTSGFSNYAVNIDNTVNPTANSTSQHIGLFGSSNWTSSFNATDGTTGLTGVSGIAINSGTGTVTSLVALNGITGVYGTGLATNATSFRATLSRFGAGSVTNYRGFYVSSPIFASSAISNIYGLYIENQSLGSVDNFAVYTAGATKSYFGGKIGIGSTTPNSLLEISSSAVAVTNPGESAVRLSLINRSTAINTQSDIVFGADDAGADSKSVYGAITGYVTGAGSGGQIGSLLFSTKSAVAATSLTERMRIDKDGNIGIGTTDTKGYRLAVNGTVIATAVTIKLYADWPDYVFKKDYKLPTLTEVKDYIDKNHHLPNMPSEKEVIDNGMNLGEMNKMLTMKVEELTLYLIEKDKEMKALQERLVKLENK